MNDFKTFTKLHKNIDDYAKIIVASGFEKLPKVQSSAQSGHTAVVARGLSVCLNKRLWGRVSIDT